MTILNSITTLTADQLASDPTVITTASIAATEEWAAASIELANRLPEDVITQLNALADKKA